MAPSDKKRKKKHRSNNHKQPPEAASSAAAKPPIHQSKRTPEAHQQALDLSQQLRQLSNQKRLHECLALYNSSQYDAIRDAHHGSIVIDCCARCGDMSEAESVVTVMLGNKSTEDRGELYIWEQYEHIPYKRMPIQAWTALLKGYVHGGMMAKADSLFSALCSVGRDQNELSMKKRKRNKTENQGRANVRTLNTLLRGCLWSATYINNDLSSFDTEKKTKTVLKHPPRNELVGGVVTAERAWEQFSTMTHLDKTSFDSSSYEYFITLLCQSLQCEKAEHHLQKMRDQFNLSNVTEYLDPSLLESLIVCLVALARAYALLGQYENSRKCSKEALHIIQHLEFPTSSSSVIVAESKKTKVAMGGKQAWKSDSNANGIGRRDQSNILFRSHRISELKLEATSLSRFSASHQNSKSYAKIMTTRLLYFSGGGTTGLKVMSDKISYDDMDTVQTSILQWYNSLWHSFGLKQKIPSAGIGYNSALTLGFCNQLQTHLLGKGHRVVTSNGCINFKAVFSAINEQPIVDTNAPMHIELGSGSGDWAVIQAESNPTENYVAVELRADRVAQTLSKIVLHNRSHKKSTTMTNENALMLTNLCCVGSECGSFLRERIKAGTVRTIFVNHPEPPTQTSTSDEEQAHMLNVDTIIAASKCLEPGGIGRIVIVTDNLIYAKLVGRTLAKVLHRAELLGIKPNEVSDLSKMEIASDPNTYGAFVHIYEGKPSASIGHYPAKSDGGSSYFDRLWRTGAGKYADMKKRYIIAARTIGEENEQNISNKSSRAQSNNGRESKSKKRSAEKQQRRNERRLQKKQLGLK